MDVPKAQKMMEWNFDFGSSFGLTAQNGPKLENWTFPTLFELGPSSLRVSWTYPRPKKWLSEIPQKNGAKFRFLASFWTYGPIGTKWPYYSFGHRIFISLGIMDLPKAQKMKEWNFDFGSQWVRRTPIYTVRTTKLWAGCKCIPVTLYYGCLASS